MHTTIKPFLSIFNIKFKFALFTLLFVYLIGLFTFALRTFRTDDPIPDVKTVNLKIRKQYRNLASRLNVGLYIRNISTLDFVANNFVITALLWFEFNKNEVQLKDIDQFSFENSKIIYKSPPQLTMRDDKILVRYEVILEPKTNVLFYRFPLEDHRLSLVLTNNSITPSEMYFDESIGSPSFIVSDKLFTSNWKKHSLRSITGYSSMPFDQYNQDRRMSSPKAVFTINFQKVGINKILLIFVPLFAAIFLALFSFLMSFNNAQGKPAIGITAITALLGYRFVIQQMSPPVGYFTLTDKVFLFCLMFAFFIFIFQLLLTRHYMFLTEHEKLKKADQPDVDTAYLTPRITERINSIGYLVAVGIFVIAITYLILV